MCIMKLVRQSIFANKISSLNRSLAFHLAFIITSIIMKKSVMNNVCYKDFYYSLSMRMDITGTRSAEVHNNFTF